MDKEKQPLPEGLNVIMHIFQNGMEIDEIPEEVKEECQSTKDS